MLRRKLPYAGLLHEVVEHNGVVYLAGIVSEDLSLDMSGQTLYQRARGVTHGRPAPSSLLLGEVIPPSG